MEHDQRPNEYISAKQFGMRFQSKIECHRFLTVEANGYLPPHSVLTMYFMRDLISGKKKLLLGSEVKHYTVPFYESISIEVMLEFGTRFQNVVQYLPEYKECLRLPRQFIINILHSIIGTEFRDFVQEKINFRNEKLLMDKSNIIEISPYLKEKFDQCTHLSNQKGIGNGMLKINVQRRRTKEDIEVEKKLAIQKQQEIELKMTEYNQLEQRLAQIEQQAQKGGEALQFIDQLVERGILQKDSQGNINIFEI